MSLDQRISALTAALRTEFWKGWEETAVPAPWEKYTTIVPSTTRIEHYINFLPVPAMQLFSGFRHFGTPDSFIYSVQNFTFSTGFMATLEDVEDDQTGGLVRKPAELVVRAKKFPGRYVLKGLNLAKTTVGFDGTNVCAASHAFGTGNNSLPDFTSASGDGKNYRIFALYFGDEVLKPLIWQNRSGPEFRTNSGESRSHEARQVRWWCDLRGNMAFGFWWNIVTVGILGTPNVTEMHTIFQNIEANFRTFKLPQYGSSSDSEYVHEQTEFSNANLMLATSPGLESLMRQALKSETIPQAGIGAPPATAGTAPNLGNGAPAAYGGVAGVSNFWRSWADHVVSNFITY